MIMTIEVHYPGRVSQRVTTVMPKIKAKFHTLGLIEKAANYPFKQFFIAPDVKFYRVLIHQLLLKKVKSRKGMKYIF